jgi:integrase
MATIIKRGDNFRAQIRQAGQRTMSKSFPKKALADEWVRDTEAALSKNTYRDDKTVLSDVIKSAFRVLNLTGDKAKHYKQIDKRFGHLALKEITREVLFGFVEERKGEVKPSTINHTFIYLGTVLRFAEAYMLLKPNIEEFKLAKEWLTGQGFLEKADRRTRRVSDDEMQAIKDEWILDDYQGSSAKGWSLPDMMKFAVTTAMRRGEQFCLRWDELDEEQRTVGCWRKHPKGKVYSRVPLLKEAMDIIDRQERSRDTLFNISSNHAAKVFNIYRDKAGIKDLCWHDLRHEGVSRLFEMGVFQIPEVAMFSGHRDIQMLHSYTHLSAERISAKLKSKGL